MDYEELIFDRLRFTANEGDICRKCPHCIEAADAIETLLAERDAAAKDLVMVGSCKTCGNLTPWCTDNPDNCKGYKWRGPQKGDDESSG